MPEIKQINKIVREITIKDKEHEDLLKTYPAVTYAGGTIAHNKLSFQVNEYKGKGWILPHNGKKAWSLFEVDSEKAITTSIYEMIIGNTKEEVRKKGEALNLDFSDIDLLRYGLDQNMDIKLR